MNAAATDPASGALTRSGTSCTRLGRGARGTRRGWRPPTTWRRCGRRLFPGQDGATRAGLRTFQTAFQTAVATGEDGDTSEEALHLGGGG